MNKFILGDCMNPEYGLPSYPDKFFDLAVVDPPYGIGAGLVSGYNNNKIISRETVYSPKNWDNERPKQDYFDQLFRTSKNVFVWGGNYFTDYLPPSKNWVIWDKVQPFDFHFNQFEMCWQLNGRGCRIFKRTFAKDANRGNNNGATRGRIRIHPTQKPVALYQWLLENYAKPGDLILDTHVGSASSLIACESLGFNYVGFEIDADYYEAAKKRMEKGIQSNLFATKNLQP
jgi:site-specific DNA-methyltransferase (adenine-specific)